MIDLKYRINIEDSVSDYFYCKSYAHYNFPQHLHLLHTHSHIEFVFVKGGCVEYEINGEKGIAGQNHVIAIMPYDVHKYKLHTDGDVFIIACPPDYFSGYKSFLLQKKPKKRYIPYRNTHKAIIADIETNEYQDDLIKRALIYSTLSEFVQNGEFEERSMAEFDLYRKAVMYISQHYTEETLTLIEMAKHLGVSNAHLSRVLNGEGRLGFSEMVNSLRIFRAKQLIDEEKLYCSEAAMESGFGSIRNFNRIFKKYFNHSPKELKEISGLD